jgi:hypothetical protein
MDFLNLLGLTPKPSSAATAEQPNKPNDTSPPIGFGRAKAGVKNYATVTVLTNYDTPTIAKTLARAACDVKGVALGYEQADNETSPVFVSTRWTLDSADIGAGRVGHYQHNYTCKGTYNSN